MPIALLAPTIAALPFVLREQVTGYAESVKLALPAILSEAGITRSQELSDQVIFLAGVRKLYSLVASSYWALDNSASLLETADVTRIRIGSQDFSRGGTLHTSLRNALAALEDVLLREEITELIDLPYSELVKELAGDGHR